MFNIITKIYKLLNQNDYNFYNTINYSISKDNYIFYVDEDEDNDGYIADNEESDKSPKFKDKMNENNSEENKSKDEDNIMIDGLELLFIDIPK
jgi:hypothetical protein